ncbi:MAG: type III-A CRISPR-associated protein Cas10/Csm1, partial [Clostridiales bacterium]|nr:type III-A CRISPR-associated protein Cas10/Csm1 [Clostridiales bacterium]
ILYKEFFSIISEPEASALSLPFGYYMIADTEESLRERMKKGNGYIRSYGKNKMFTGKHLASKIWVGDYTTGDTFEELAEASTGIRRIGILRADVDNLGRAFVSGFEREKNQNRYVTLSRTAALSRQLSMFFKFHINDILAHPDFTLNGIPKQVRKVSIVYSGGDDLFLVGAWDDVLEASVDIRNAFERYTEGTLSISAGIGLYYHKYPIHVSAFEVAGLEDESKQVPGKNAITFLPDGETHLEKEADGKDSFRISDGTYSWPVFLGKVINEKYRILSGFFQNSEDRGRSFLYHLLELVRKQDDKINLARYVYLLARMEPDKEASQTERQRYKDFSEKMYEWIQDEKDCRQLKTAITLYAYSVREKGGEEGT